MTPVNPPLTTSGRPCRGFCNEEGFGPFAGVFCIDEEGHDGGHLYEDPRTLAFRLTRAEIEARNV